jgi:hypothetical protein
MNHLENIILNDNAYFYENNRSLGLSNTRIKTLFALASKEKAGGRYLLNVVNNSSQIGNLEIKYSVCVFKYYVQPSFIEMPVENWYELKFAYLIIAEIENYIVINKKNISGIHEFTNKLLPLDYSLLSTLFVDEDTQMEKLNMKNMDISDTAIRQKTLEASDLKDNFSGLGAGNYVLNNVRLKNDEEKVALTLNTSRINQFGTKNDIEQFLNWASKIITKIANHQIADSFLSIFAAPQDYEALRHTLTPIASLMIFSKLYEDYENNHINKAEIKIGEITKEIDLIKHLSKVERLCKVVPVTDTDGMVNYRIETSVANDIYLRLNDKSITIYSAKLRKIFIVKQNGRKQSIIEYLNSSNQFIVNFDNVELVYTNRKLFKDTRLLGSIDFFMKIFKSDQALNNVTSEKGDFTNASTSFAASSIFNFVEATFKNQHDYFICDDLSKEWADHIGIDDEKITFYHSKWKSSNFSASDFQDIVGQAQKNLGNLVPQDYQLNDKAAYWANNYNNNNAQTQIPRLRKGTTVLDAVSQFKKTKMAPNLKREVNLVVNFISKSALEIKLQQLVAGHSFAEKNEVIQIMYTSFVNLK